jgi:hypothetical protein
VADVILHYVMPVLFVIDWLFLVPKETLKLKDTFGWLAYPIVYLVWTFIHGAYTGFYPYPLFEYGRTWHGARTAERSGPAHRVPSSWI